MTTNKNNDLQNLTNGFKTAMLITHDDGHPHARPMYLAKVEGSDLLWFATTMDSDKVDEIRSDGKVCVSFQGTTKFASVTGDATVVVDSEKIDSLWQSSWDAWFPKGKDGNVALIKVHAEKGEVWDLTGKHGVDFLLKAGKALWNGKSVPNDAGRHEQVSF